MLSDTRAIIRRNRDFLTLLWLIAIILVAPYLEMSPFGALILVTLVTAFLLSALYSVSDSPSQVAVGFLLAIPTLLCAFTFLFNQAHNIYIALLVSICVFLVFILLVMLHKVMKAREVTLIELFRAIMVYLMIGLAFGLLYMIIESSSPHSFMFNAGKQDVVSLIYFSFVALSTAGFGDIVPVTPVARSIVIMELLTGVMYLAVLIGFLVNAHYSARFSKPREEWKEEGVGAKRRYRVPFLSSGGPLTLVVIGVMLNMATSLVIVAFGLPLFLDTWGTSFVVIMSGFPAGAAAGIIYNVLMAATVWGFSSLVFATSSLLIAAVTWYFWKLGWVDVRKPHLLVATGILTGVANALYVFSLSALLGLGPYAGIMNIYDRLLSLLGNPQAAFLATELVVEPIDKTFCIVLAAVAAVFFTRLFQRELEKGKEVGKEP